MGEKWDNKKQSVQNKAEKSEKETEQVGHIETILNISEANYQTIFLNNYMLCTENTSKTKDYTKIEN